MLSEQIVIFIQIVLIDLVLAGDNAIIIGMVASQFPAEQRKKIIFWGISGAVILRIILTLLTAYLLQIKGLRLIGGLALLYIVYKLYVDVIKKQLDEHQNIKVNNSSFFKAISTVLIADFTMSLDNVLGVAGAAKDHYFLLVFGLLLSIAIMAVGATLISGWIKKYEPEEYRPGVHITDDEELVKAGADFTQTIFHPVGTCKMGNDDMAVVDDSLRVRGIQNLRVIDASIMPNITSGNTNAPTIMIAEKGADMILNG